MYMHTHHILFARSSVEGQQFRNAVLFLFIEPTPSPSGVSRVPGSRTLSLPVLRGVGVLLRLIRCFIMCGTSSGATEGGLPGAHREGKPSSAGCGVVRESLVKT